MIIRSAFTGVLSLALVACTDALPERIGFGEPEIMLEAQPGPPGARPGSCWGKSIRPAVIETVTEQLLVQPAEMMADGRVISPAIYRTETQQRIVKPRHETWFETPCPDDLTPEFIASLQRALKARGYFRGVVSGAMDGRTRAAIRRYQSEQGLESGILSIETGRELGLIAIAPEN